MEFTVALALIFWLCFLLVLYVYAGYPVLIWGLAHLLRAPRRPPSVADAELPSVSLLLSAYNEEAVIDAWIRNALAQNYPADKLEIVVASDGSSDATTRIVRTYAHRGVRLLDYSQRRGKARVLRAAFAQTRSNVVVLSDANTQLDRNAVRHLVRWFQDPRVGVVCGRLVLVDAVNGRNADGAYWKYETFLKKQEARLDALLGANGAIYAIRRDLEAAVAVEAVIDDFVIPLRARLLSGCSLVYDDEAVAREETAPGIGAEFQRRARLGAGGYQSIFLLRGLLHPRHGWLAFAFLSHKVLRWLCPFFLLGMLASNVGLLNSPIYRATLLGQALFYALSVAAAWLPTSNKPLRMASMFTSMNTALLVGFCRWLLGNQKGAWKRTPRITPA